jgi:hypothetical protein
MALCYEPHQASQTEAPGVGTCNGRNLPRQQSGSAIAILCPAPVLELQNQVVDSDSRCTTKMLWL